MAFQSPLTIKYDANGKPIGLTENNTITVSSVSATTLILEDAVIQNLTAVNSNVTADLDQYSFVLNNLDFTGSPLNVQKVTFYAPSSTLPAIIYTNGTVVSLASDGSSLTITPDSNVTHDNIALHFGNFAGTNGNNIHWQLTTLNSYYINTSGDTMVGTLNAPYLSSIQYADFNLTAAPAANEGRIRWNDDFKTLEVDSAGTDFYRIGQEVSIRIKNDTGSPLTPGTLVYVSGYQGNVPTVALASASSEATSHKGMGMVKTTINDNNRGLMIIKGILSGVNTSGFTEGEILKLDTVPGKYRSGLTTAPSHNEWIGSVVKVGTGTTDGIIFVDIQHGYETNELHDVSRTHASATGQILVWDNTGKYYSPQYQTDQITVNFTNVSANDYKTVGKFKYTHNIERVDTVLAVTGGDPSISWNINIGEDRTVPESNVTGTCSSSTTGDLISPNIDISSNYWVWVTIDSIDAPVKEFTLTLHLRKKE